LPTSSKSSTGSGESIGRRLIEAARRGLQQVGVDVRRHRATSSRRDISGDVFKALVEARDRGLEEVPVKTEGSFIHFCAARLMHSRAQLMQDLFALYHHDSRRGGYFVEFGGADGLHLSNTVLLERGYDWKGIVAEPARCWHEPLRSNRQCTISTDCVWHTSDQTLVFNETPESVLSTIDQFSTHDSHHLARHDGERYEVDTVSLLDLLARNNAPRVIDYLSVDTEGSEFDILNAFDFNQYDVRLITVEHNFTPKREALHDLLRKNGFVRKFEALSQWDDWYVREDGANNTRSRQA
jgi:FkbM family methyltransferase